MNTNTCRNNRRVKSNRNKSNRNKRIMRKIFGRRALIMCITIIIIVCFASFNVSANTSKRNNPVEEAKKQFVSYQIQSGDNLYSIARDYCDTSYYSSYEEFINEVIKINKLRDDNIIQGRNLILPVFEN